MIALLNTSINAYPTGEGASRQRRTTVAEAKRLLAGGFESFIGHPATAALLTDLLGVEIPVSRASFSHELGETALVFKVRGRLPSEGTVWSRAELEQIGYDLYLLTRFE